MSKEPYARFQGEDLILRDELAIDRTLLANEATLLAYVRSALTLLITGVTFIHLFDQGSLFWLGVICIPLGLGTAAFGTWRFRRMQALIARVRQQA